MHSFAVIAGFAAAANAYGYGYAPAPLNTTSVATPAYEASKTVYPVYPAASSASGYAASSGYPVYSVASSAPAYTTTKIVSGLTTVCPEPTTLSVGSKTYIVSTSTTIIDEDCEYTTTYVSKPSTPAVKPVPSPEAPVYTAVKPSPSPEAPAPSVAKPSYTPPAYTAAPSPPAPVVPYPSSNGTVPGPAPSGAAKPSVSATKPASPEFTGAAAQAGVGLLAVIGAVAAFL